MPGYKSERNLKLSYGSYQYCILMNDVQMKQQLSRTRSMRRKLQTRVHAVGSIQGLYLQYLLNRLKFDFLPKIARLVLEWLVFWSRIKMTFHPFRKLYRKWNQTLHCFFCCDCFDSKYDVCYRIFITFFIMWNIPIYILKWLIYNATNVKHWEKLVRLSLFVDGAFPIFSVLL